VLGEIIADSVEKKRIHSAEISLATEVQPEAE